MKGIGTQIDVLFLFLYCTVYKGWQEIFLLLAKNAYDGHADFCILFFAKKRYFHLTYHSLKNSSFRLLIFGVLHIYFSLAFS